MNCRKRAIVKALRKNDGASGYYVFRHMKWLWQLPLFKRCRETSYMVDKMISLGYRFTSEELAIIARVMRKGNPMYFEWFEHGKYVPTERDISKVSGKLELQESYVSGR